MGLSPCPRCARLWFLLPWAEVLTGGTVRGWWQPLHLALRVSAWQNSWVVIPFMSCCLCGTSVLVYSLSHQHMRGKLLLAQAASTSACIMLCSAQPLLQGRQWRLHLPSCRVDSHYSQELRERVFFPDKNPSRPAVSISALCGKTSLTASLVPQGGASHQLFMLCVLTVKFC